MKNKIKWPFVIVTLGFVGLGIFSQNFNKINESNGDQSYASINLPQELRKEEIKIETLKKVKLTRIEAGHDHAEHNTDSVESFDETDIFDDSVAGVQLQEHFDLLENTEPGSQQRQDDSLEKMREKPEVFVAKLAETYDEIERLNFLARYKVVYMMENLKTAHAIPFLSELASSEQAEETAEYKGDGNIDETHRENLIRMRAVGGLYALAQEGDAGARNSLFDAILNTKDLTVKIDAIKSYLSTSKDLFADTENLKTLLPEDDHQFFNLKVSSLEEGQKQIEQDDKS
jgi:hypothetical protein